MTTTPITPDQLWDALRDVACTTGRKAQRIVLVHKSDVEKALGLLKPPSSGILCLAPIPDKPGCYRVTEWKSEWREGSITNWPPPGTQIVVGMDIRLGEGGQIVYHV